MNVLWFCEASFWAYITKMSMSSELKSKLFSFLLSCRVILFHLCQVCVNHTTFYEVLIHLVESNYLGLCTWEIISLAHLLALCFEFKSFRSEWIYLFLSSCLKSYVFLQYFSICPVIVNIIWMQIGVLCILYAGMFLFECFHDVMILQYHITL